LADKATTTQNQTTAV